MFGMLLMMMARTLFLHGILLKNCPKLKLCLIKRSLNPPPCTFGAHFVLRELPWEWRIGFRGEEIILLIPAAFVWSWACCSLTVIKCIYPDNQCIYPDNQTISWTHGHKHMGIYAGNLKCDKWSWFRQPNARGEKAWFCDGLEVEWWGQIEFVRRKSQSYLTSFVMGIVLEVRRMSLGLTS